MHLHKTTCDLPVIHLTMAPQFWLRPTRHRSPWRTLPSRSAILSKEYPSLLPSLPLLPLLFTKCVSNKGTFYKHAPPTSLGFLSRWPCMFVSAHTLSKHSICKSTFLGGGGRWLRARDQDIDWKGTVCFPSNGTNKLVQFNYTTYRSLMELTFIFICSALKLLLINQATVYTFNSFKHNVSTFLCWCNIRKL